MIRPALPQSAGDAGELVPPVWRGQIREARFIGGRLCGVERFAFTGGLLVGLRFDGLTYEYTARYCYENRDAALAALRLWGGDGDPPGPWVKEKVSGRFGPGLLEREAAWQDVVPAAQALAADPSRGRSIEGVQAHLSKKRSATIKR